MDDLLFIDGNLKTFQLVNSAVTVDGREKKYYKFLVSGEPLRNILGVSLDSITPFGWGVNKEYEKDTLHIFTFRKKPRLETGRVMIYVCAECGDIDCGAITANIVDAGSHIIWKNFGSETEYEGVSELFGNIEPMVFKRQNYFQAFQN